MVYYCRIGSNVWFSGLRTGNPYQLQADSMEQIDRRVLDWRTHIPEILQCANPYALDTGQIASLRGLQIQVYVRTNIMRVLIYRPVLYNAQSIADNRNLADLCLYLAKDTIRVLYQLNKMTGIYETRQASFSFFVLSSLATILLACFNAPAEFCACVQEEVFMALELINGLNQRSWAAKRLWKVIQNLRDVGERLGVLSLHISTDRQEKYDTHAEVEIYESLGNSQIPASIFREDLPVTAMQISDAFTGLLEVTGVYRLPPASSVRKKCGSCSDQFSREPEIDQTSARQSVTAEELWKIIDPLFQHS
jgi:hypothetical protein